MPAPSRRDDSMTYSASCSSPSRTEPGPSRHKRPSSPAGTTGSLSTFAISNKRPCESTLSGSRQTQSLITVSRCHSNYRVPGYPEYTALTSVQCSATADDDDDDLDEAVSSFRAPFAGHSLPLDQSPRPATLYRSQPIMNSNLPVPSASAYSPVAANGVLPFRAVRTPVKSPAKHADLAMLPSTSTAGRSTLQPHGMLAAPFAKQVNLTVGRKLWQIQSACHSQCHRQKRCKHFCQGAGGSAQPLHSYSHLDTKSKGFCKQQCSIVQPSMQ